MEKTKNKQLPNLSVLGQQMVFKNLGVYCTERKSIDLYFFVEAINIIISDMGEPWVEKICKKNNKDWNKIRLQLDRINVCVNKTKMFYDGIQDKKFERKDMDKKLTEVQSYFRKYFMKTARRLALTQRDIYDLFFLLVNNTSLKIKTISLENFKVLEGGKVLDLKKKNPLYDDVAKVERLE